MAAPSPFAPTSPVPLEHPSPVRIRLALSGGGFRATLFHLGVVAGLRNLGVLNRVDCIAAVSGGSILAADLALHWSKYCGNDDQFAHAAKRVVRATQQDVRGRILRRFPLFSVLRWVLRRLGKLPLGKRWRRRLHAMESGLTTGGQLERSLRRLLYGEATLRDLGHDVLPDGTRPPRILILATDLAAGNLGLFTNTGFARHPASSTAPQSPDLLRVSKAVASSSAFPGMFSPVRITPDETLEPARDATTAYLSDGGIVDNSALSAVVRLGDPPGVLLASDAGGTATAENSDDLGGQFRSVPRVVDVWASLSHELQMQHALTECDARYVRINISDVIDHPLFSKDIQRQLGAIRTDFDHFSDIEVAGLVTHGAFLVANNQREILPNADSPAAFTPRQYDWVPTHRLSPVAKAASALRDGRNRHWRSLSPRDWWTALNVLTIGGGVMLYLFFYALALERRAHWETLMVETARYEHDRQVRHARAEEATMVWADSVSAAVRQGGLWLENVAVREADHQVAPAGRDPAAANDAWKFVNEDIVFDLTRATPERDIVQMRRKVDLRKIDSTAVWLRIPYRTSGSAVRVVCTSHEFDVSAGSVAGFAGRDLTQRFIWVDLGKVPYGGRVTVEIVAQYEGAFTRESQWWAGSYILEPRESARMLLVFSGARPWAGELRRHVKDRVTGEEERVLDGEDDVFKTRRWDPYVVWQMSHPAEDKLFEIEWVWRREEAQAVAPKE